MCMGLLSRFKSRRQGEKAERGPADEQHRSDGPSKSQNVEIAQVISDSSHAAQPPGEDAITTQKSATPEATAVPLAEQPAVKDATSQEPSRDAAEAKSSELEMATNGSSQTTAHYLSSEEMPSNNTGKAPSSEVAGQLNEPQVFHSNTVTSVPVSGRRSPHEVERMSHGARSGFVGRHSDQSTARDHGSNADLIHGVEANGLDIPGARLFTNPAIEMMKQTISSRHSQSGMSGASETSISSTARENRQGKPTFSINPILECRIQISIDQDQLEPISKSVHWLKEGEYKNITKASKQACVSYLKRKPGLKAETLATKVDGSMTLLDVTNKNEIEAHHNPLTQEGHWSHHLPIMVGGYCAANPHSKVRLDIRFQYVIVDITPKRDETFANAVYEVMKQKFEKNWKNEEYMPSRWIEPIFTKHVIRRLVKEDKSLGITNWSEFQFTDGIWLWGTRLLAICIHAKCDLICLHKMIMCSEEQRVGDGKLPIHDSPPHLQISSRDFDDLREKQKKYNIFTFEASEDGRILHYDERDTKHYTMPIKISGRKELGKGSFGIVYQVEIDKKHHNFQQVSCLWSNPPSISPQSLLTLHSDRFRLEVVERFLYRRT
jgi:hypothetical protein